MELDDAALAVPSEAVGGDDRLRADLEICAGPDDPGLDRAERLICRHPIDRGAEGDLDQRDKSIERLAKPDVLHAAFEVRTCPEIIESTFERVEYGFTTC